jgi:hypothetical protein
MTIHLGEEEDIEGDEIAIPTEGNGGEINLEKAPPQPDEVGALGVKGPKAHEGEKEGI